MYKLNNFTSDSSTSFESLLMTKWDEIHKNTDIFRYKIDKLEEKVVDGKYFLQLNPDRRSKRRAPQDINNVCQPFDENKFNFNKASPKEILFSIEGEDGDIHNILVNVSPISRYNSLLCPFVNRCLPQVVTLESLTLVVQIMFLIENRDIRIGFNSLCGLASVNHLHYHLLVKEGTLYVENVKWHHVKGHIYRLDESYPMPGFCVEIPKDSSTEPLTEIWKILEYFLKKSIAHNILVTRRKLEGRDDAINIIVWPRKNVNGAKEITAAYIAVLELSGWVPVYDEEAFKTLRAKDLVEMIQKWTREDFNDIDEDIKYLL